MSSRIGLIAGMGDLPLHVADEATTRGLKVVAIAFPGLTNPSLERVVEGTFWLKLGQLEKAISIFKSHGVEKIVMAGKIEKSNLLKIWNLRPDGRALRMIRSLKDWRDDTILAAIAEEFRKDGILIDEITSWAGKLMASSGVLTKRAPNDIQWKDIAFGRTMARGIGALDIGQTVVVKNAAVIAVEAIEGTDKTIRRAAELGVSNAVIVKMAKPQQDMRFDVPGIGPSTIDSMIAARARVLAIETGKTMITDFSETVRKADGAKISIVGIPVDGPVTE
jgi:DUF1009 family protein